MTLISTIQQHLLTDAELEGYLPGGIYNGEVTIDISRQATPEAYDEFSELKPCVILKSEATTPWGPHHDSGRHYITFWMYAQHDIHFMELARERIYQLIHRAELPDSTGIYDIRHANDILGTEVTTLGVPTTVSRYVVTIQRAR